MSAGARSTTPKATPRGDPLERKPCAAAMQTEQSVAQRDAALLRKIFDTSLDQVSIIRRCDGRFIYVNDEFLERGYSRDQVIGHTLAEIGVWPEPELECMGQTILGEQGLLRNHLTEVRMKDGRIVPYLISSWQVELEGEECVLSIGREISELKKAQNDLTATVARLTQAEQQLKAEVEQREQALADRDQVVVRLRESEDRLRKIFDASPQHISINSMVDGRLIDTNRRFESTGYSRADAAAKDFYRLFWANPDQFRDYLRMLRNKGVVRNMEVDFRTKDGSVYPCLLSSALVEINGESCVVSFTSEITRLKRAEQQVIASREAALAASRAKSEFLSNMSHEIRTPMNAILGMADLLAETELSIEQRRYVATMTSNGNALLGLINDILDLAKVESGKLQLEHSEFDLRELIESAAETLGARAAEKGLELLTHVLPDLPPRVVGDQLRLRQILLNVLGNSIKFTERGEVGLTVGPAESESGRNDATAPLHFSVRDTGIGIPGDKLDRIFETFTQADSSTTRKYGGSGLGLAIVSRLVELMGGRVWIESEVGKGTTFHFTVRFGAATGEQAAEPSCAELVKLRVLVVDDNQTNRLILREMLARQGVLIGEASDGEHAVAEAERAHAAGAPYKLVLLDCRMPVMDGFEVAQRLKRRFGPSHPVILMLTSDDISPKLSRVRELGIDAYLVKPVKRQELFRAIAATMGRMRTAEETTIARGPAAAVNDPATALKILLAEDSPDNRLLIQAYVKSLPYQIDPAENGQVAVEKFMRQRYDLVLMDIRMPVMDGHTAARKIREWERAQGRSPTPIVALTASALEEDVRSSLEAGCTTHVSKPVRKALLLETIRALTKPGRIRESAEPHPQS